MKAKNLSAALDSIMGGMKPKNAPVQDPRGRKLKYAEPKGAKPNPFAKKSSGKGCGKKGC